jgi:hypothetical protein
MTFSEAYVECLKQCPFPGRIDPWAEAGLYFQQIHSGMINDFLGVLGDTLLRMGYLTSRERSLQIIEPRQPDISIRSGERQPSEPVNVASGWNYEQAAVGVSAEPGIIVAGDYFDLDGIHIKRIPSGELVTVLEIISPSNKTHRVDMQEYIDQRDHLIHKQGVNFVELDLTRSVKRLLQDKITVSYTYHIAIYIPHQLPRVIGMEFEESIKPFALPLREEVILVEPQGLYDSAYRTAAIAAQIEHESRYTEADLPFPTLLSSEQRSAALAAVEQWMNELERLK